MTKAPNESGGYTVLVWYDLEGVTEAVSRFYDRSMQWMVASGYPPDLLSVHGPGFGGKPLPFEPTHAKLQRSGFRGVSDVTLFALTPGGRIPLSDYEAIASFSAEDSFAFLVAKPQVMPLAEPSTLRMSSDFVSELKPRYGIGCLRDHQLGPAMYAIGIAEGLGVSDEDDEEALRISSWSDGMEESVWRDGFLRDVYPWNFLNGAQLAMPVSGLTLERWISQDATKGSLERFSSGLTLWRVAPKRIGAVRAALD